VAAEDQHPVAFGPFRLDRRARSLTRAGAEVTLGRRAFDVLCVLASAGGEAVSKDTLLELAWPGLTVEENNLQVQISALRKALGEGMITTIPGRGYRLTMARPGGPPPTDATAGKPSIAVLPFTNMSGDIEQEYFADGVADDIITELARVKSLFVIARNSSFAYRARAVDVRQIASELGVRYILEGSVSLDFSNAAGASGLRI
jgi:DNA-binding winged helix-turn-helix (wHTH) protein